MRTLKRWSIFGPLILLAILLLTSLWLMYTQSGLTALVSLANRSAKVELTTDDLTGTLAAFQAEKIELKLGGGSIVLIDVAMRWKPLSFPFGSLKVEDFNSAETNIEWVLQESENTPPRKDVIRIPELPLAVFLDQVSINLLRFNEHQISNIDLAATVSDELWLVQWANAETAFGKLNIAGQLNPTAQLPHSINIALSNSDFGNVTAVAEGNEANTTVAINVDNIDTTLQISLYDLLGDLHWSGQAAANNLLPTGVSGSAELNASGNLATANFNGKALVNGLDIVVDKLSLERNQDTVDAAFSGHVALWPITSTANLSLKELRDGQLNLGRFALDDNLALEKMSIRLAGDWQALSGELVANGYVFGPASMQASLQTTRDQHILIESLTAELLEGSIEGSAMVNRDSTLVLNAYVEANDLNPALIDALLPYSLNADSKIGLDDGALSIDVNDLQANIKGVQQAVLGTAALVLNNGELSSMQVELNSGISNSINITKPAASSIIRADVAFQSISSVVPELTGSVAGNVAYNVETGLPTGNIELLNTQFGKNLALEKATFEAVELEGVHSVNIIGQQVVLKGAKFDTLQADMTGSSSQHEISIRASTPVGLTLNTQLNGALEKSQWQGSIDAIEIAHDSDRLSLTAPARLIISKNRSKLEQACLNSLANSEICVKGSVNDQDATLDAFASMAPNESILNAISMSFDGPELAMPKGGKARARFEVNQAQLRSGEINLAIETLTISPVNNAPISIANFNLDAKAKNEVVDIAVELHPETGMIRGHATVEGLRNSTIDGELFLDLPNLADFTNSINSPQITSGDVNGQLAFNGPLSNLIATGSIDANNLEFSLPEIDTNYTGDITMSLNSNGSGRIEGKIKSKNGDLDVSGILPLIGSDELNISIVGERFMLADSKDLSLSVNPDLSVETEQEHIKLIGEVRIDQAFTTLQLPQFQSGATRTADIVFVDQEEDSKDENRSFVTDVNIILENPVRVEGNGLLANVDGAIRVSGQQNEELTADGELTLSGVYNAYGQSLDIESGSLTYTNSSITNPYVDLYASRTIDDIIVGVRVTGKADNLLTRLESNPVLPESEVLHYLVLGRAPGQTTLSEQDLLAAEAVNFAIRRSAAGLGQLGEELAGTELSLSQDVGQLALSIGKQLSSRLWVGYTVGLLEPIDIAKVRYQVSPSISLEAEVSDESRGAIKYRFEKK